jgi:hypothetical protein
MKPTFVKGPLADANGEAALALVVSLLDVLVTKTKTLSDGQVGLIMTQALSCLPEDSPRAIETEARALIVKLNESFKRPKR